jgi:Cu-Zn family superoxide dismutase
MINNLISTKIINNIIIIATLLLTSLSYADEVKVPIYETSLVRQGKHVGYIIIEDTSFGLLITPYLDGLKRGIHGFHMHEGPSCEPKNATLGLAAGQCFDPFDTGQHLGPYDDEGHLGDLPVLYADSKRQIRTPVLAPRLTLADTIGHSFVICEGPDNYSDEPKKTGGGGARSVCGFISVKNNPR